MNGKEKIIIKVDKELEDLIPNFLENRKKDVAKLKEALQKNDFEALCLTGHTLHGVGGGYGFNNVTVLGEKINKAAKAKDTNILRELIAEFEEYMLNVEVRYE